MSDGAVTFDGGCSARTVDASGDGTSSQRGRFQPGRSGNPKGRPRRSVKKQSAIEAALDEMVTIKDSRGTRKITVKQAIAKRLVQKAMAGDIAALKELQRECPDFLKEVIGKETDKSIMTSLMRHLVSTMSESAVMEFRNAIGTWKKK